MKKFFTLIAAAMMAVGAYAGDEEVTVPGPDSYKATEKVTKEPSITLSYSTLSFGEDMSYKADGAFKDTKCAEYEGYVAGLNNPADEDGNKNCVKVPASGTFFKIEAKENGTAMLYVKLNASKSLYVQKSDGTKLTANSVEGFVVTDGDYKSLELGTNSNKENSIAEAKGVIVSFNAVKGETYYVYCTGSKLGCFGYRYYPTGTATGISSVEAEGTAVSADAPTYNLSGQKVDSSYKGIVVKDGKKYINK